VPIDKKPVYDENVIKAQSATRATAVMATQPDHPSAHCLGKSKELVHIEFNAAAGADA
jgi:hypothetical protein